MIKILHGSAVTKAELGGLAIYRVFANFLLCMFVKNFED